MRWDFVLRKHSIYFRIYWNHSLCHFRSPFGSPPEHGRFWHPGFGPGYGSWGWDDSGPDPGDYASGGLYGFHLDPNCCCGVPLGFFQLLPTGGPPKQSLFNYLWKVPGLFWCLGPGCLYHCWHEYGSPDWLCEPALFDFILWHGYGDWRWNHPGPLGWHCSLCLYPANLCCS